MHKILQGQSLAPNTTLSTEIISFQANDSLGKDLTDVADKMLDILNSPLDLYKTNAALIKNKVLVKLLGDMEDILYNRLGIKFNVVIGDVDECFCMPATPAKDSNLMPDTIETMKSIEVWASQNNVETAKEAEGAEKSKLMKQSTYYKHVMKTYENMKALYSKTRVDGVIVDREKAKMYGLPSSYKITVCMDLIWCFRDMGLTSSEFVAIILHEIGHAWTVIEYSIRNTHNTTVLLDAIKETVNGKSPKEVLCIAAENIKGNEALQADLRSKNIVTVYLTTAKLVIGANKYSSVDAEQLADQFVARFGLGKELATAVEKVERRIPSDLFYLSHYLFEFFILFILLIALLMLLVTGPGVLFMGAVLPILTIVGIVWINNLRNSPNASDYAAYDDRINRAKRIKFDLIRTIRSNKLPKEVTKDLLNQLDVLDTIINVASKDKTVGLMDKFSNFFRFNGATIKELENIDKVTESLMENDLHALTAKLKIIKGL